MPLYVCFFFIGLSFSKLNKVAIVSFMEAFGVDGYNGSDEKYPRK